MAAAMRDAPMNEDSAADSVAQKIPDVTRTGIVLMSRRYLRRDGAETREVSSARVELGWYWGSARDNTP